MKALDYDGVIEMVMPDIKCLANARKDTYYLETVKPDEEKFIELSEIRYMVGWVETYIHRGKAVGGGEMITITPMRRRMVATKDLVLSIMKIE